MTTSKILSILAVVLLLSVGQLLFKLAASRAPASWQLDWATFASLATNYFLVAAIALYAATTFLWVYVLRDTTLSQSYPFTAIAMVLVPLAGVLFFGETASLSLGIGGLLVVSGILVIAAGF